MDESVLFHIVSSNGSYSLPVEGELVEVAPHLRARFAVHPCAFKDKEWKVSHVDSGAFVAAGETRALAINLAVLKLATRTQAQFDEGVAKAKAKIASVIPPREAPREGTSK